MIISDYVCELKSSHLFINLFNNFSEMFHGLRTNKSCQNKFIAIKMNMSKAYDMTEWKFSESPFHIMGFDPRWINLMVECISLV